MNKDKIRAWVKIIANMVYGNNGSEFHLFNGVNVNSAVETLQEMLDEAFEEGKKYKSSKLPKMSKAEQIKWAEGEIKEYQEFIKMLEGKK